MQANSTIAYFSMEIGLEVGMPTYSGGLGVLAGDTIRSAADLKVPMVAVTLIHHKGYFRQRLELDGRQVEELVEWIVNNFLQPMLQRAAVTIEGRAVQIRAWKYEVSGAGGFKVPVYFLDADLPENSEWERTLTHFLYGGDQHYRLCQEAILGLGGVKILRALGYKTIERFHMNEGHSSLLTLDLLDEVARAAGRGSITHDDVETVRKKCVFTTHTPVPAGHDQFPMSLVTRVFPNREDFFDLKDVFCADLMKQILREHREFLDVKEAVQAGTSLNMTYLALNLSGFVNGVAKQHGEVSRMMFNGYDIAAITK